MQDTTKPTAPARSRQRKLPAAVQAAASLQDLQQLEAFQKANAHVFPSVPSLRWFYRQHRAELLEAGAVLELAGRLLIHAPTFAQLAITIGSRTAKGEK